MPRLAMAETGCGCQIGTGTLQRGSSFPTFSFAGMRRMRIGLLGEVDGAAVRF